MKIKLEVVVDRDPDGPVYLTFFRDGKQVTAGELGITAYHVDPGAQGATTAWAAEMADEVQNASPAVQAAVGQLVADYVR